MADIQLPTARAAGTGTGALLKAYRLSGDTATYVESSPVAQAAVLSLKRTEPKATKDYAGACRGEHKFTRNYADLQGRLWPAVFTSSTSLPAFLTNAQKTAFVLEASLSNLEAVQQASLALMAIPQS